MALTNVIGEFRKITDNIDTAYTTDYLYDQYNRLIGATAGAYSSFYVHDPFGNITNFSAVSFAYQMNSTGAPATNRISSEPNRYIKTDPSKG